MKYKIFESELDLEQTRYDLAMNYANLKLQQAMENGDVPKSGDDNIPEPVHEVRYLQQLFCSAYMECANLKDEGYLNIMGFRKKDEAEENKEN